MPAILNAADLADDELPEHAGLLAELAAGTASNADVYRALGWEVVPHGSWQGRVAKRGLNGRLSAVARVTRNAGDALYLIDEDHREEAVRAAMDLIWEFKHGLLGAGCPVARRICCIAILRPELRAARPAY